MRKLLVVLMLVAIPALAEETVVPNQETVVPNQETVVPNQETVVPNQEIGNTKSYTGINYNRQDSEQVGVQKITNDHSWFNINIQIIKKGVLFQLKEKEEK